MKTINNISIYFVLFFSLISCSKSDSMQNNTMILSFNNTFKQQLIVLGDENSQQATINISQEGQKHHFSELKYVISNIRLINSDGVEFPYHINNLDEGAAVIDQSKPESLDVVLKNIPEASYKQIKFGLGLKRELNLIDQIRFPKFFAQADKNDTQMMWEWGTGYRFTKIEGFYDQDNKKLSVHTGSTIQGNEGEYTQGVDAYREIVLDLPEFAQVGQSIARVNVRADFDKLLSGKNSLILNSENDVPNTHNTLYMLQFVENLGGDGQHDLTGMFSIINVSQ